MRYLFLTLCLAACGCGSAEADQADAGGSADADPSAPDARSDAASAADARADADSTAPDAGLADAGALVPDATPACTTLPCYADCDPVADTGCPLGGGCYVGQGFMGEPAYTYCATPGGHTYGQSCTSDDSCTGGFICLGDGSIFTCYDLCRFGEADGSPRPTCGCTKLTQPPLDMGAHHYGYCAGAP